MIKRNVFLYNITNRDDEGYGSYPFEDVRFDEARRRRQKLAT